MSAPKIDEEMQSAVKEGVFPGAHLLVFKGESILHDEVYGWAQITPAPEKLTRIHLFDLASLTKPLCTATLAMIGFSEGCFDPTAKVAAFFPSFNQEITLGHLLSHTAGLPDWKPYYQTPGDVIPKILAEPLVARPGEKVIYSDLGYILLGAVLEKIFNAPLDRLFEEKIARPLNLIRTTFNPLWRWGDPAGYAATEDCPLRGRVLRGEVHDDNAFAMGGVAGHAGLFGSAGEVARWIFELRQARLGIGKVISKKAFELFCQVPAERDRHKRFFTLGFDTPSDPSSSGKYFSSSSLGHLGYAGTSFWWDPVQDFGVVLLTNRVHPSRDNDGIKQFRPLIHDVIARAFKLA